MVVSPLVAIHERPVVISPSSVVLLAVARLLGTLILLLADRLAIRIATEVVVALALGLFRLRDGC